MAELDSADRKQLDKRQFAFVDKECTGHLAAARRHEIEVSKDDRVAKPGST